jgi:hypothetical protein
LKPKFTAFIYKGVAQEHHFGWTIHLKMEKDNIKSPIVARLAKGNAWISPSSRKVVNEFA